MAYSALDFLLLLSFTLPAATAGVLQQDSSEGNRQTLVLRALKEDGRPIRAPVHITLVETRSARRHSLWLIQGRAGRITLPPGDYRLRSDVDGFHGADQIVPLGIDRSSTVHLDLRLSAGSPSTPQETSPVHIEEVLIPAKARKQFLKAQEASDSGRYSKALKHLRKASKLCPKCFQAHNNLGVIYLRLSRWPEAEDAFKQALRIKPDDNRTLRNLAVLLTAQSRDREAEPVLRLLTEALPSDPWAFRHLAAVLKRQGREAEASRVRQIACRLEGACK